jgi:hypothetical protein
LLEASTVVVVVVSTDEVVGAAPDPPHRSAITAPAAITVQPFRDI